MITQFWKWRIKVADRWTTTLEHLRAEEIKFEHPEALPVLGTLVTHQVPDFVEWYKAGEFDDVPF